MIRNFWHKLFPRTQSPVGDNAGDAQDEPIVVQGDHIVVGEISGSSHVAIGYGARTVVSSAADLRDRQYDSALNWDGQRLLREFDLSERDLSGLNLAKADLRKANLREADLRGANLALANLSQADLRGANLLGADLSRTVLDGAAYSPKTIWPAGFDPRQAGARPEPENPK